MIRTKNVTGINVEHNSSAPGVKASTNGVYGANENQEILDNAGAARRVFPDQGSVRWGKTSDQQGRNLNK